MSERLETIEGRPALVFERRLDHSVERVWRAIADPGELAQWFVAPIGWTPREGERFESMGAAGEVTRVEEPRLLEWVWGGELQRVELTPDGDGCLLVLTHLFDRREQAGDHAGGWDWHLRRLDALLAGRNPSGEEERAHLRARTDAYSERFGIDPEIGRRALAEHGIE